MMPLVPSDYYGLMFLVGVSYLFENERNNLLLFYLIAAVLFGVEGVLVALFYWVILSIVRLGVDFFNTRREASKYA